MRSSCLPRRLFTTYSSSFRTLVSSALRRSSCVLPRRESPAAGAGTGRRTVAMASPLHPRAKEVLEFWFGPDFETAGAWHIPRDKMKTWFNGGDKLDQAIRERFAEDLAAAVSGRLDSWLASTNVHDALAGIVLMDQFSRNMHRGTPSAFGTDSKALSWAKQLVGGGRDLQLPAMQRSFVLMPYMHSEELADQEECVRLFQRDVAAAQAAAAAAGGGEPAAAAEVAKMLESNVRYAVAHRDVVARWGRFPQRNAALGRPPASPEEAEALAAGTIPKF